MKKQTQITTFTAVVSLFYCVKCNIFEVTETDDESCSVCKDTMIKKGDQEIAFQF